MKNTRRTLHCLLALLTLAAQTTPVLCAVPAASAQDESAAALYKAVEDYPRDQRAEMRAQGKTPDRDDMERLEREKRELAERSAAKLAARQNLAGLDLFYLGALYNLAGKKKETLEAMRRYLADGAPSGAPAQAARNLVAVYAAQNKLFEEAEAARAAYLANEPKTTGQLLQNEHELGIAYLKAKQYERAVERSSEAFRLAKSLKPRDPPQARREEAIFAAGETLAAAHSALKRKEESLATVVELFRLALELPSAHLYRMTASRFPDRADDAERAILALPSDRVAAPSASSASASARASSRASARWSRSWSKSPGQPGRQQAAGSEPPATSEGITMPSAPRGGSLTVTFFVGPGDSRPAAICPLATV